jgi:hypothetical protein
MSMSSGLGALGLLLAVEPAPQLGILGTELRQLCSELGVLVGKCLHRRGDKIFQRGEKAADMLPIGIGSPKLLICHPSPRRHFVPVDIIAQ